MKRYSAAQRAAFRFTFRTVFKPFPGREFPMMRLQRTLVGYGFPVGRIDGKWGPQTSAAVLAFQVAFNGGRTNQMWLVTDGKWGPKTKAALYELPYLSRHFQAKEVWSKGNGDCYIRRELLKELEITRTAVGRPIRIISGYRDPAHNKKVGGAPYSRHLRGEAVDISRRLNLKFATVYGWRQYGGIGYLKRTERVTHVDVRQISGGNSPDSPARWTYPEPWWVI